MSAAVSFEPLTPTSFLERSGKVYADRIAVIDGATRYTYAEFLDRCMRLSGALRKMGAVEGARVAVLAPNTHVLLESHYGVPLAGAVLVALNVRLTPDDLAFIVSHSGAAILIYDRDYEAVAKAIAERLDGGLRLVRAGRRDDQYEHLLASAEPYRAALKDERGMISINYTSGTTGRPKGVMYHPRGAYLQALAMALEMRLDCDSTYLWTLPMFHCNGWCFTWAVTAAGGTHLCLRRVEAEPIWRHLCESNVTHFCGAPTVLVMLAWHPSAKRLDRTVRAATGAVRRRVATTNRMNKTTGAIPNTRRPRRGGKDERMEHPAGGRNARAGTGSHGMRRQCERLADRSQSGRTRHRRCHRHDHVVWSRAHDGHHCAGTVGDVREQRFGCP